MNNFAEISPLSAIHPSCPSPHFYRCNWAGMLATAAAVVSLAACGGGGSSSVGSSVVPATDAIELAFKNNQYASGLRGAWRVLGEGSLLEVTDKNIVQFQQTDSLCYADNRTAPGDTYKQLLFRQSTTASREIADFYLTPSAPSAITLERIPQIPANCRNAPPTDPLTTFKTMWYMFNLDYGFFKERNIDWQARFAKLAPKAALAADDNALQAVLVEALADFNDEHVNLVRWNGGAPAVILNAGDSQTSRMLKQAYSAQTAITDKDAFDAQWRMGLQNSIRVKLTDGSAGRVLNGAMVWGKLPGNIGYIELSRLSGFSADSTIAQDLALIRAEMDRAILGLKDTKAILVDIAVNDGGLDIAGAEVAGSFADARRLAFAVQQQRPQGRAAQSYFVEPKGVAQYRKPVYLLTTDRTVSAGDTLTLMMRELPNVTHVGQPTSGSMSNLLAKPLPGNFIVTLSNERYLDAKGVLFEGRGITPKVAFPVFDPANPATLYSGHDAAIERVMGMMNN